MPKDKNNRTSKARSHPYKPCGAGSKEDNSEERDRKKDWEDAICPICLEYPHNAVLLMCTSHENGCRPYMCNTSYRHSNCLDQYRKAQVAMNKPQAPIQVILEAEAPQTQAVPEAEAQRSQVIAGSRSSGDSRTPELTNSDPVTRLTRRLTRRLVSALAQPSGTENVAVESSSPHSPNLVNANPEYLVTTRRTRRSASLSATQASMETGAQVMDMETGSVGEAEDIEGSANADHSMESSSDKGETKNQNLVCPLCRGKVSGWHIVDPARKHLNDKSRSCSQEECTFVGTYEELRMHARCQHPSARPSEVDPARQRDWRRLERQRDLGDVLSSIRSAMPGATVLGDYVIDNDVEMGNEDMDFPTDDGHWWTVFLLFQFFSPTSSVISGGSVSSRLRGHQQRRHRRAGNARLRQWIENLQNVSNDANNSAANSGVTEAPAEGPQRRQRSQRRHQGDAT